MDNAILQLFPLDRRDFWRQTASCQENVQEIRLRAGRPVVIHKDGREVVLTEEGLFTDNLRLAHLAEQEELEGLLQHICHYSIYAFEEELRQGYITVSGGHRVGVSGQAVPGAGGQLHTIKNIAFINIRIAHQVRGAGDTVLPRLYREGGLKSTLILSPPGCGKTTLLRDLIRQISDGNRFGPGMTVGVVDERSEIAGSFCGRPQNDVGMRTDVLDACPKALGMMMLLRAMSPQVICIDELGSREELEALKCAAACGCRILATAHGESVEDAGRRFGEGQAALRQLFQTFLLMGKEDGKCVVKKIVG